MTGSTPPLDIAVRWRKWDGTPHWQSAAVFLGDDEFGAWFARPAGTHYKRPGHAYFGATENVFLVPVTGEWVATYYPDTHPDDIRVYIDLAAEVSWNPESRRFTAIDMDLDVVESTGPRGLWIDDEDEFEEHATAMSYPADVIASVAATAAELEVLVERHAAPFGDEADAWLALAAPDD